jgi:L-ribulokinase
VGKKYAVGIDYGTESGRAVLVDVATGEELATAVYEYSNGVIVDHLPAPDDDVALEFDWALQDPADYIRTVKTTVPSLLAQTGVDPSDVLGIGIDVTACTMLPTKADGTPLSELPEFRRHPHAWVKLWKHHAAQPQANRINAVAEELGEPWLPRYGGKISSEWFFSKSLQILEEAPEVYRAADRLIEATDWIVWQLTGVETRNSCTAGYKAIWTKGEGFPSPEFFGALDPEFANVVDEKMSTDVVSIGERAGSLTKESAEWTGLLPGTAVAVGNVDAHVSVPASTVTEPGRLVAVMGTSTCHMILGQKTAIVEGMCGVVEDGVIPGLFGFEAGQPAVGDIFAWYVEHGVPPAYHAAARDQGVDVHTVLENEAARLRPGESGLLAIDWWNGNRSVLVDADLSGVILGATLETEAPAVYRALIEATAFGTRVIVESFKENGIAVEEIVACGGLPERNRLMMQIYSDVTGLPIRVALSSLTGALGSAMFGAVAAGATAGGYDHIVDAAKRMAHLKDESFRPDPAAHAVYDLIYDEYRRLHDYFGRENHVMKRLKSIRAGVLATHH